MTAKGSLNVSGSKAWANGDDGVTYMFALPKSYTSKSYKGLDDLAEKVSKIANDNNGALNTVNAYKLIFVFILLIGPVIKLDLVWTMADIFNALMSIPNLIAVVVLSPVVVKETNYYLYGNRLDEYDKTKLPVVNK